MLFPNGKSTTWGNYMEYFLFAWGFLKQIQAILSIDKLS